MNKIDEIAMRVELEIDADLPFETNLLMALEGEEPKQEK